MTIKLGSLSRWLALQPGHAIMFEKASNNAERRIRLHVNVPTETAFLVENDEGPRFLAVAGPGLETIEFAASGKIAVFPDEGGGIIHYQTAEGEPTFAEVVDPKIFTKIANRRHRNPELEEMMFRMEQNMQRRLAQQAGEMEAALARRLAEAEHGRPTETVQTNAPGANPQPVSNPARETQPNEAPTGEDGGSAGSSEPSGDAGDGALSG